MDDLRERLTAAAEYAAGFEYPDGQARAAVRQAITEHPDLEALPYRVIGAVARQYIEGVPIVIPTAGMCLACSTPATGDVDGALVCSGHERPYRAGVDRAIANSLPAAPVASGDPVRI